MLWPVVLTDGEVVLRPLGRRDARAWRAVRAANTGWLTPWEATAPDERTPAPGFGAMVRSLNRQARSGRALPFAVEVDGRLSGQVTVAGIVWGSLRSGHVGYWVDRRVAGRGVAPTGVALAVDHCFTVLGLHRLEVNIRPENTASLRVVAKLGLREEGIRRAYLHIDGGWRDHRSFAVTAQEVPGGLLARYRAAHPPADPSPTDPPR